MVMWDDKCIKLMDERWKNETRRLYNPNKRPGVPGAIHWIKKDRTPKVYGQYLVLKCEPQRWGDVSDNDAFHEGFLECLNDFKEYWYSVNGHIEDDDLVWKMKMLILWTNSNGVILNKKERKQLTSQMKIALKLHNDMKTKLNTYAPYRTDPISPFSIKEKIVTLRLYNVKDKDIYEYIENNTPYDVYSIYHNGFSSEIDILLDEERVQQKK